MTTILEARDELAAAVEAAGVSIAGAPGKATPPCGVIFGEGIAGDSHALRGQARVSFRVTLIAGAWDVEAAGRLLTGLVQITLGAVRALPSWQLGEVRRDNVVTIAGGQMLAADVTASRMADI